MSDADALRRAGRPAEAATLLRAVVDEGDRRAPLAAFTLGKLHAEELRNPAAAARWFERAASLGLPSGLDEEAEARAVECYARAGLRDDATRAADRYQRRFPEGRQLARVKGWAHD
jgi:transmembrane sensor